MKTLILRLPASLLVLLVLASGSFAQQKKNNRFAFVQKERDRIFIKEDIQIDEILAPVPALKFRAERIAVLGSTSDGKALLVAGRIYYAAIGSGVQTHVDGFFRIPLPFDPSRFLTDVKILKRVTHPVTKILPLGVITPNDQEWFGIWQSGGSGDLNFRIFHGRFDQNDNGSNVDSVMFPTDDNGLSGGYHMSNMTTSVDGATVYFLVVDKLTTSTGINRLRQVKWTPSSQFTPFTIGGDYGGAMHQLLGGTPEIPADKAFGFGLRAIQGGDNRPYLHAVMATEPDNQTLTVFEIGTSGSIKFDKPKQTISRSILPAGTDFFTGYTENSDDVFSEAPQRGNGGDMMFSRDGNAVVFVVQESPDNLNTKAQYSGIYKYDFTTGQLELVYNDETKMERQPIFVEGTGLRTRGYVSLSTSSVALDSITIGKDTTFRVTITNSSPQNAEINSITLGQTGSAFSIVANERNLTAPFKTQLDTNQSMWFDVRFRPTGVQQYTATMNVTFETDSSRSLSIVGFGKHPLSVKRASDVFKLSVSPNPFSSKTRVNVTAVESTDLRISLVDMTGKEIATSAGFIFAGQSSAVDFDAVQLNLAAGSYRVVVNAGALSESYQVVFTR